MMARKKPKKVTLFLKSSIDITSLLQAVSGHALKSQLLYYNAKGKSTHLQVIPQQSTQIKANLPLQACDKNQQTFLVAQHGCQL